MPATTKALAPLTIKEVPRTSGVYEIRCIPNGKFYIGSAVNLRERWRRHRWGLKRRGHHNELLQNAWDKYGEENFTFTVLEYVEREVLLLTEQKWINETGCTDRKRGFNISDLACSGSEHLARDWNGFIDPNGNEISIYNLHEFCRQNGLNFTAMRTLFFGNKKLRSHKGWSHKNNPRQRDYIKTYEGFIDPDGNLVPLITNLTAFCRAHDLDNTHLLAVMRGRICSHRGWTHINSRKRSIKIHTGYVNPQEQHVTITNLVAFCKANGLTIMHMHDIRKGRRKSHKGWTWRPDHE
jgi:group I intron endonuclease